MEIVVGVLVVVVAALVWRLVWLDRLVQRVARQLIEVTEVTNKLSDLMLQSGEILLSVVNKGKK